MVERVVWMEKARFLATCAERGMYGGMCWGLKSSCILLLLMLQRTCSNTMLQQTNSAALPLQLLCNTVPFAAF